MRNCDIHATSSAVVSGGIGFGITRQPSPVLTLPSKRWRSSAPKKSINALPFTGTVSELYGTGEVMRGRITVRATSDQVMNRYDCLLTLTVRELIRA